MINEKTVRDRVAYERFNEALRDLLLRFPLCGLSYLGEAIEVREDATLSPPTLATDGRKVRYHPEWMRKKDLRNRVFDILHEWLHIFYNHTARRGDRDPAVWNIAGDIFVVRECCRILSTETDKWLPPADGVQPKPWAENMTVEEIYDALIKHSPEKEQCCGLQFDAAAEYSEKDETLFKEAFASELIQAQALMENLGRDDYGETIKNRIAEIVQDRVPWGSLLRGNMIADFGFDYASFARPRRKYFPHIILPSLMSMKERILLLGIDVSASVGQHLLGVFAHNVAPAAARAEKTVIVTFDQVVREIIETRRPQDVLKKLKFATGAHSSTSAMGVFAEADKRNPSSIAVLTDGYIERPDKPYPNTHWIIPTGGLKQPWGKNYVMSVSW